MGMSRVFEFWEKVIKTLTDLLGEQFPMDPYIHLLNDDSTLGLTVKARKACLAGLTAAQKIIVQRWKPPHDISKTHWLRAFLDIAYLTM